jgi:integrase
MAKTRGIYKRGNIYWIRYAGFDGRVKQESSGSTKFKDAEALLLQRKHVIREGKQPPGIKKIGSFTFNQVAKQYLKWCERQRSFKSKKDFINRLIEYFGNLPLRNFTTMAIELYQTEKSNRGNKPATINRHVATLKHMFSKAVQWEMVETHVAEKVRQVKLLEENNKRLRYLSKEECHTLLSSCDAHLRPIVIMAMNTGMRKGEILNLKWDNVDLKNGFLLLDKTKNGGRREVPINHTLESALKNIVRRLDILYVFYNPVTGKPYDNIKKSFNSALKRAGVVDFKFHDLRHTFASQLVMAGIDLTTVKELLGHKSLVMTLRYAHLAPSHKVKAVNVLDSTLNDSSTIQKLYNLKG